MNIRKALAAALSLTLICAVPMNPVSTKIEMITLTADAADESGLTFSGGKVYSCPRSAVGEVEIPAEKDGVTITSIGRNAFNGCTGITAVKLPDTIQTIEYGAFSGCKNLTKINLPEGLTEIGAAAFMDCSALEDITLPHTLATIGDSALGSTGLSDVVIYGNCAYIGSNAFAGCKNLSKVTIYNPDCDISLLESTFCNSYLLDTENSKLVAIVMTATIYGKKDSTAQEYARSFGRNFELITDDGTTPIKEYTEGTLGSLKYRLYSDRAVISGTTGTITGELVIPETIEGQPVMTIYPEAFKGQSQLTSLVLPSHLKYIPDHSLTTVDYKDNTYFYGDKFSALESITVSPDNPYFASVDGVLYSKDLTVLLSYPAGRDGAFTVPDGVVAIAPYAFEYCAVPSVTLPEGLVAIEKFGFYRCIYLKSIALPDSLTSIGNSAFQNDGLESIVIPKNCESIGVKCFFYNKDMATITILNPTCELDDSYTITNTFTDDYTFDGIIKGYKGSTAESYAVRYRYDFEPLSDQPSEATTTTTITTATQTTETTTTSAETTTSQTETSDSTTGSETSSTMTTAAGDAVLYGDANDDGKVSIADATAILQYIANRDKFKLTAKGVKNADCNAVGDGITAKDALAIQMLDADMITELPASV